MEIAVLSDIHGNDIALSRCLEYSISRGIRTFVFLGDLIGELAYPQRTMKRIYDLSKKYQCYFIKGNKEEYWLNYRANGEQGWKDRDSTTGALLYAYHSLTERDMEFFAEIKTVQEITFEQLPRIICCHGSPYRVDEKLLPNDLRTQEIMSQLEAAVLLCGHTHVQRKLTYKDKCALNPGAVGVPLSSGGRTQFLILHGRDGGWTEEFISLEYDTEQAISDLKEAKLYDHAPYWSLITERILRGSVIPHSTYLVRAMELCREETGSCIWPDIPELYWAKAYDEIIELWRIEDKG